MVKFRRPLLWILLLSFPFYFLDIGRPACSDGEAIYSETPREMRLTGDWITPHINGARHFDKPPLLYWLTGLSQIFLGEREVAARIWPALASWATILIVGLLGGTLYGARAEWLSALVFASCLGPYIFSRMAQPDSLLRFFVALAMLSYLKVWMEGSRGSSQWLWVLCISLGLAGLSKGILGIGLPAGIIGLHAILSRRLKGFFSWRTAAGTALVALILLPWHVSMAKANPDFFGYYVIHEHILRLTGQRYPMDECLSLPAFLGLTLIWTFPWLPLLPHALTGAFHRLKSPTWREEGDLLPVLWISVVLGLFIASRSRLEYYALPAIPAFALLMGKFLSGLLQGGNQVFSRSITIALVSGCAILGFSAVAAYEILGPSNQILFDRFTTWWPASGWTGFSDQLAVLEQIRLPAVLVLAGAAVFTLAAATSLRLSRPGLTFGILTGMMAPIFILVHWGFLVMEPFQSSRQVADILKSLGPDEVIVCQEPREYKWLGGITFYTRQMVYVLKDPQFEGDSSHRREPAERFLNPEQFQQLWKSGKKVALVLEDADEKPAGSHALGVVGRAHVVARVGSRAVVANELSAASVTGG